MSLASRTDCWNVSIPQHLDGKAKRHDGTCSACCLLVREVAPQLRRKSPQQPRPKA